MRDVIMETSGIQTASARLPSYVSRVVFFPFPPRNDSSRINASRDCNLDHLALWSPDTGNGPQRVDETPHGCHSNTCPFSAHLKMTILFIINSLLAVPKLPPHTHTHPRGQGWMMTARSSPRVCLNTTRWRTGMEWMNSLCQGKEDYIRKTYEMQ